MLHTDRLTDLSQTRLDYWTEFVEYMRRRNSQIRFTEPGSKHQLRARANTFDSGEFVLVALAIVRPELLIGVGLEISAPKKYYDALAKDKSKIQSDIEKECGEKTELKWDPKTKVKDIWSYRQADFFERQRWPEQHEWLYKRLEAFRIVLKPRIMGMLRITS